MAYNNTKAVKDFPDLLDEFKKKSAVLYKNANVKKDIHYHLAPRTRFDYFSAGKKGNPTFIFIHGGYWQNCNKDDFAFIAEGILNSGIDVILAEYTLAPKASMTQIVNEIHKLLNYLETNYDKFNLVKGAICLGGHSAGGHLTAVHRSHPLISHSMPISALVDLIPISLCWLNEKLRLTPEEIKNYSPINHITKGGPTHVHVGGRELPELIRHSNDYFNKLSEAGENALYQTIGNYDHFTQLNEFINKDGVLVKSLKSLLLK
ncbi:MAG: alpha/beta hydrolase [Enterobacteriaceae bacterium]|nr:alpha/beta hydrolase [Enterobacteriaceae bacterium]